MPTNWNLTVTELPQFGAAMFNAVPGSATGTMTMGSTLDVRVIPLLKLSDNLVCADTASAVLVHSIIDGLRLEGTPSALWDALAPLEDNISFRALAAAAQRLSLSEALTFGGNLAGWRKYILQLADAMALSAGFGSTWNATAALASGFVLRDTLLPTIPVGATDTLQLTASQMVELQATMALLDQLLIAGVAPAPSLTVVGLLDDNVELGAAQDLNQALIAQLKEGVQLLATLALDDGVYRAWVMNAESHAFWQYTNYPFNSFAELGGKFYGAKSDGIYLLEGADDAGTPIDAHFRSGLSDFGVGILKQTPTMYIGYTTDGELLVKVTVSELGGTRQEHWYKVETRPAGNIREGRVKIGLGLRSAYWEFELANVDGADFAFDSVTWHSLLLDRRL